MIVSYNAGDQIATVYSADKTVMRRLDRLVADYQEKFQLLNQTDVSKTYSMPKSYFSYHKPRKLSEEQRKLARDKMKVINPYLGDTDLC